MDGLTDLQRESIQLAYYGGYSYPEVAQLLGSPSHSEDQDPGRTDQDA